MKKFSFSYPGPGFAPDSEVTLKLLIDTKANKVLFAEGGKEFVDFLFHIMSLPIGTVIRLLNSTGMVGSLGALYNSIESLSNDYFQSSLNKASLLKPVAPVNVPLLALNVTPTTEKRFYRCNHYSSSSCNYYTDASGTLCRNCSRSMNVVLNYVGPTGSQTTVSASTGSGSGGYVKGVVTYMVMDNLEVKPMSTISGITLINNFNVKDISALIEKEVHLGFNEGLAMLKASMETHTVLTSVFLSMKGSV